MLERKIILVLADGLGDRPTKKLDRKTPLEVALTPNFDELAQNSALGLLYPIAPGVTPGSDTSHLSIFGYDPYVYYKGRGPFEALGVGIELAPNDVAFRGNFATLNESGIVVDRRAGRELPEAKELISALNEELKLDNAQVIFKHATEHRFALVLRGEMLSADVTDTDPHKVGERILKCEPKSGKREAMRTAQLVNEITQKAHEILDKHPLNIQRQKRGLPKANAILLRGAGSLANIPSFQALYRIKGFAVSGTAMIRGFCKAIGLEAPVIPGATGDFKTDVKAKAKAALDALEEHDFVYVHFKATDAAGHDKNAELKVKMVEKFDQLVGELMNGLKGEEVVCVTGDHSTPVDLGEHSADPVPLLISAPDVHADGGRFTEAACAFGSLGRLYGRDLIRVLLNQANRIAKFGE
ncbi:phosphoglycerate mutase [Candidatus Marsarchaeota G1 archaeon BE_D]|jgi:2,3-bisphosphoglycerate-independent phosphoglycerate mutase|uniref:2,3-bisphosphoglycerate-independent phosphoglycerate mutase n=2 Tax=Candidatus Marsarchaeota TaxID=1978152 RepID=A0A2R6AIW2_9ARCH|nr:MAG: phosphoglycerate mutase [Candidatus Marsarchaeota G1 archaeon BE_D]